MADSKRFKARVEVIQAYDVYGWAEDEADAVERINADEVEEYLLAGERAVQKIVRLQLADEEGDDGAIDAIH